MTDVSTKIMVKQKLSSLYVSLESGWRNVLTDVGYETVGTIHIVGYSKYLISLNEVLFVIDRALQLKTSCIIFSHIDFFGFKEVKTLHPWPIKSLLFKSCSNLQFYHKQIFTMTRNKKGNSATSLEHLFFENRKFSLEQLRTFKAEIGSQMSLNFQITYIYIDTQSGLVDQHRDPKNLKLNYSLNAMIKKNIVARLNCRQAVFTVLMAFERRAGSIFNLLPREIIMMLAKLIWSSRTQLAWIPQSNIAKPSTVLDLFDWKLILQQHNRFIAPMGNRDTLHLKLDSRLYDEWVAPLNELLKNRCLLTSLLITVSGVIYEKSFNVANCKIYPRTVAMILSKLIDAEVEQLEMRGIDFDDSKGYDDVETAGSLLEDFNGEDDKMHEIDQVGYRDLRLTEVRLVKCLEIGQFLRYLFKYLDKDSGKPYAFTGIPAVKFKPRDNDYFSEVKTPKVESSILIRINSTARKICISEWQ
jgi:hypothetical protein